MDNAKKRIYVNYIKRFLDVCCCLAALVLLLPLIAVIALAVRIKLGSPVIFKQKRPGKDGRIFTLVKFRTMTDERDENGALLCDDMRLTKFGKFLRATSLDELPELVNILIGDMSFVGPRPLLVQYLPYYTEEEKHRHDVRPGLTGWAQVNGRNYLDWERRFEFDIEYIECISFVFDVKILFLTVKKIFERSNVAENTNAAEGNFADIRKAYITEKQVVANG